jgi:hypothetical protein
MNSFGQVRPGKDRSGKVVPEYVRLAEVSSG